MVKNLLKVSLAAGAMLFTGAPASAFTFVPAEGEINLTSNPGGAGSFELTGFAQEAKVNREAAITLTLYKDGAALTTINTSDASQVMMVDGFDKMEYALSATISFYQSQVNPATASGDYTFTLPKGTFIYKDGTEVEEISGHWTIENMSISTDPADFAHVDHLQTVTLTFDGASALKFTDNTETVTEKDDEGNTVTYTKPAISLMNRNSVNYDLPKEVNVEGNKAIVTFDMLTEPGTYDLTVKAGCFEITRAKDGKTIKNEQYDGIFYVEKAVAKPAIIPAEGTYGQFDTMQMPNGGYAFFKLTFDQNVAYTLMAYPTLKSNDGSTTKTLAIIKDSADPKSVYLAAQMPSERTSDQPYAPDKGNYVLTVPSGAMQMLDGSRTQEYVYHYTIGEQSGVAGVDAAEVIAGDVYNVAGVLVRSNATSDDVKALAPGLYIVGGKKVCVK